VPVGVWSWLAGCAVDPGDDGSSSELRDVALLCCPEESAVSGAALWSYARLALVSAAPEALEWAGSGVAVGAGRARRAGVGDSGEDDAQAAGWVVDWDRASGAEDGGEDSACRS